MVWAYPITKNGVICGEIHEFSDLDWERLCKQPATKYRWRVTENPKKKNETKNESEKEIINVAPKKAVKKRTHDRN